LAQQRISQAEMKAVNQQFSANRQLAEAKRNLELAKSREKNIMAASRLAAGGTGSDSPSDFANVLSSAVSLESSAENFQLSCCGDGVEGVESTCPTVRSYLASLGKTPMEA